MCLFVDCGGILAMDSVGSQNLKSLNYPNTYPVDKDCTVLITVGNINVHWVKLEGKELRKLWIHGSLNECLENKTKRILWFELVIDLYNMMYYCWILGTPRLQNKTGGYEQWVESKEDAQQCLSSLGWGSLRISGDNWTKVSSLLMRR
jgi:hypothetical protein